MKKVTSLFSCVCIVSLLVLNSKADAQITITSADMPSIGYNSVTANDTLSSYLSKITPGASGANVTWNFSFLPNNFTDTDYFLSPSSSKYYSLFPSATIIDSETNYVGFIEITNSSVSISGVWVNADGIYGFGYCNPPEILLNLPSHYGDTIYQNSNLTDVVLYGGDSLEKDKVTSTFRDSMDAWGSITTPLNGGTTYNVLRQKNYEFDIDSVWYKVSGIWECEGVSDSKEYGYTWYAKENGLGLGGTSTGFATGVASMTMDTTNTIVTSFSWYDGAPLGLDQLNAQNSISVYPNPCTTQIAFHCNSQQGDELNISVYDITGRKVGETGMINGTTSMNTSEYSAGMYFYSITDISGKILDNGKFTVLK